jgi:hypothetical protein
MRALIILTGLLILLTGPAAGQSGCPQGSYSVAHAPDGSSLTILFDELLVSAGDPAEQRKQCSLSVPLNLPEGYSLGVYRVDYRGFAHLTRGDVAELTVDYNLGPRDNGRRFRRSANGPHDGDFIFTENIGAGLMRRVGCGVEAVLDVSVSLELTRRGGGGGGGGASGEAMAAMDSSDGTAKHGLVYYLDLRRCS